MKNAKECQDKADHYRRLLATTTDEKAIRAITSMIEEYEARARQSESAGDRPNDTNEERSA